MKIFFLIFLLSLSSGCVNQTSGDKTENDFAQPKSTTENTKSINTDSWKTIEKESDKVNGNKTDLRVIPNERFRQIPVEFKDIDFKNFKYPLVRLKNGEYEEFDKKQPSHGSQTFSLSDVSFVDLFGDATKEAVVIIHHISCGASCDGGSSIIHFYFLEKGKPKLIDWIELGSLSSACSLKSLKIVDKKIRIEQFGRCKEDVNKNSRISSCKFCIKDLTKSVYSIEKSKLVRESSEEIETPEINVMNYDAEVIINE